MLRQAPAAGSAMSARHAERPARAHEAPSSAKLSIGGTRIVPTEDVIATGKALRGKLRRRRHAAWKGGRRDPIEILRAEDAGRLRELVPIRYGLMLQSPFTFFRGAAAVMAADLANTPRTGINVQLCGDCHVLNFGGFATPERNIIFDINDFDETLPGPWEWDVKRLATSFILGARSIGLPDARGWDAAATMVRSYRKTLREFSEMPPLEVWRARITSEDVISSVPKAHRARIRARIEKVLARNGSELDLPKFARMVDGDMVICDTPPLIYHPETTQAPEFWASIDKAFGAYRESLADDRRVLLDQYSVVDAALKVTGIGSVGRRCWIALLMSATGQPLILQFKEAVASAFEPYLGKSRYRHHGQRIVIGQRLMQPASDVFLGWATVPTPQGHRQFYVRQLRDAKIKPLLDAFDAEMLSVFAKTCGRVLARAHAKAGSHVAISGYLGTSERFDDAIADFAVAYADQSERDYAAFKAAVKNDKIKVYRED